MIVERTKACDSSIGDPPSSGYSGMKGYGVINRPPLQQ